MNNIVSIPDRQSVAQWLVMQTPNTVSEHIDKIAKIKGLRIQVDHRFHNLEDGRCRMVAHSCRVVGNLQNTQAMAYEVEKLLAPADKKTIKKWLTMLDAITAKAKSSEASTDVAMEAYALRLMEYPADIAKHVLIDLTWRFFPPWADLKVEADALLSSRKMIINRLKSIDPKESKEPEKPEETQDQRVEFAEKIMARFKAGKQIIGEDGQLLND